MPAVKAMEAIEVLATRVMGTDSKVMGTDSKVMANFTGAMVTAPGIEARATGDMDTATKDVARVTGHSGGNRDIPVLADTIVGDLLNVPSFTVGFLINRQDLIICQSVIIFCNKLFIAFYFNKPYLLFNVV